MTTKSITKILTGLKDENEIAEFLSGILTPNEITNINQRLKIVEMLKSGKTQQSISRKLGVGIATVSRGAKILKNKHLKIDFNDK